MKVFLSKANLNSVKDEVLAVFLMEGERPIRDFEDLIAGMKKEQFEGKAGQAYSVTTQGKAGYSRLLLVGLGKESEISPDSFRKATGTVVRYCVANRLSSSTLAFPKIKKPESPEIVRAIAEAALLANFKYDFFKTKKDEIFRMNQVTLLCSDSAEEQKALKTGLALAGAQNYVRSLQELPGNVFTPERAVQEAKKLASERNFKLKVFGKADLQKMKMHGILAVNQGSDKQPCLIQMEYNSTKKNLPLYALVGKGVCFDSGGINLKPSKGMEEMKYDKTGALAVFGILRAASDLNLPVRLITLTPFVENMPSGSAQRPGDVITMYNGKTVEVLNTDAEGRLILADALAYAAEKKPSAIFDLATLTGAMVVALGRAGSGYFTNEDLLARSLDSASEKSGEKAWRLPMWPEFHEQVKGVYGDIRNVTNTGEAGSATAACFLSNFIGESKWVHIDIAGTDMAGVSLPHPYIDKGAAGPGVRLVAMALHELASK